MREEKSLVDLNLEEWCHSGEEGPRELTLLGLSDRVGHLWASFRIGLSNWLDS